MRARGSALLCLWCGTLFAQPLPLPPDLKISGWRFENVSLDTAK